MTSINDTTREELIAQIATLRAQNTILRREARIRERANVDRMADAALNRAELRGQIAGGPYYD